MNLRLRLQHSNHHGLKLILPAENQTFYCQLAIRPLHSVG